MDIRRRLHILLVEDEPLDVRLIQWLFEQHQLDYPLHVVHSADAAMDALRGTSEKAPIPQPCLVLLDLHLPQMNGIEFLRELRQDPKLTSNLVFVLSTSNDDHEKRQVYQLNAAGYLLKAELADDARHAVQMIRHYAEAIHLPTFDNWYA